MLYLIQPSTNFSHLCTQFLKPLSNPFNSTYEENNQSLFQAEAIQVDEGYVYAGGGAQRTVEHA